MVKIIQCTACNRSIKVEGTSNAGREVTLPVSCPYCNHPNEVEWPIGGAYKVNPAD